MDGKREKPHKCACLKRHKKIVSRQNEGTLNAMYRKQSYDYGLLDTYRSRELIL